MATHALTRLTLTPLAGAALLGCASFAHAQASTTLSTVTVVGKATPPASVAGWGDVPLAKSPFQAGVIGAELLRDVGAERLADLTRIDPSISDGYNSEGYWDILTVRGYVIDNRFNYRRDGLPINAETSIPLDNKARIEVLKGTSGMQAGTSAPGGLVNYIVKRPTDAPLRDVLLQWRQGGTVYGAVDLSQRFGVDQAFGLRVNAAAQRLHPPTRSLDGERSLFALAGDWRLTPDTLLEAEFETSHRRQPSVPGLSMLGAVVPQPGDPRINLNNQPWSKPVVFDGDTGSLRWQQRLAPEWKLSVGAGLQRLRTDDHLAYSYGCSAEGNYDRYCSDGTFDFYDFESKNERRTSRSIAANLDGKLTTGALVHELGLGLLQTRFKSRLQPRLDDGVVVGTGSVDGLTLVPSLPALGLAANTNRTERSTELQLRDRISFGSGTALWAGVRHTRLQRASVRTDGSRATDYTQSFTTPWLALTQHLNAATMVYASWGRGVESDVAPNRANFINAGQALPALKSRQSEIGIKGGGDHTGWSVAFFDITRPQAADLCADAGCTLLNHQIDGSAHHSGIDLNGNWDTGPWTWTAGLQQLRARVQGSQNAALNGQRPTNVPATTVRLQSRYDVAAITGLALQAGVTGESDRMVLPDNSARIPGWARADLGLRYEQPTAAAKLVWRAGVDNVFDRRAWRESPYQYGHAYLYPLPARAFRLSIEASL